MIVYLRVVRPHRSCNSCSASPLELEYGSVAQSRSVFLNGAFLLVEPPSTFAVLMKIKCLLLPIANRCESWEVSSEFVVRYKSC